ncbi:MAG: SLAC1 anion channel family protein [Burkholderiales bacterium]|nr:SLAC1 anion channel family protein [Burkholderiales bacterium]
MSVLETDRPAAAVPRLALFPISFFGVVMGIGGLGLAWGKAETLFGTAFAASGWLLALNVAVFAALGAFYLAKLVLHPQAVAADFGHPVRLNFFATLSIGLLLVAIQLGDAAAARWLWACGAVAHIALTLYVMTAWIHQTKFEITHLNPAWFLPVVGNVLVPIAGVAHAPAEVSWFFFSVGLVFWLALFTIVLYRLFFHAPLPVRLTPTLFILIAPPAVAFVAYHALTGAIDVFARVLYHTALFLTLLLASNAVRFLRARFFLSAWAYTFPLAAVTVATLIMAERTGAAGFAWIGAGLLAVLTLVVAALFARTVLAIVRGEICVEEG